mgnify:CR=1
LVHTLKIIGKFKRMCISKQNIFTQLQNYGRARP